MSSIKKVLCLNVKDNLMTWRILTAGDVYDVVAESMMSFNTGKGFLINDDYGRPTTIITGDNARCMYGKWQPLEQYMCMTNGYRPRVKKGDILFGYEYNGVLKCPVNDYVFGFLNGQFKKVSEIKSSSDIVSSETPQRYEVRHIIYDTNDNKIVNDAMGECYITLAEAQEVCDEMNSPVEVGDIFKHSDGTAVEVVNSTLEETEVMLEVAGSVYYSKYNTQQFLKEFKK